MKKFYARMVPVATECIATCTLDWDEVKLEDIPSIVKSVFSELDIQVVKNPIWKSFIKGTPVGTKKGTFYIYRTELGLTFHKTTNKVALFDKDTSRAEIY